MAKAKFQIYKDVAGRFRFRLRAPNNKIVAVGEAYGTKDGCLSGIYAIRRYSHADIEDLTTVEIPQEEEVALEEIIEDIKKVHYKVRDTRREITGGYIEDKVWEILDDAVIRLDEVINKINKNDK